MPTKSYKSNAQVRSLPLLSVVEQGKRLDSHHYVEGYAARFEPYILFEDEKGPVWERFDRNAFDGCDMSDIIFQYDHSGKVFARTGNGTLLVEVTDDGLFVAADLGRTSAAKQMYEDIGAGMVRHMSWRFTIGDCEYLPEERTIVHHSVKKIYDVSAVSIPANKSTEINARAWADGVIALSSRSEEALDERRRKLRLKINIQEVI